MVNQVSLGFIMIEGPEDQGKNIMKHHLNNVRVLLNQIILAIKLLEAVANTDRGRETGISLRARDSRIR